MAEPIISIVGWFVDPIKEQMKYLFNVRANMRKLKKAMGDLKVTRNEVEGKIKRATEERDDEVPTERVLKWLDEAQTAQNEVTEIEGDYNQLKMCFRGCPLNCWSGYRVGKRATVALAEVKDLHDEEGKMDGVTKKVVPVLRQMPDNTLPLSSTENILENAIKYLKDETVGMIGIWGMGGIGKTTLLKRINNHPEVKSADYDLVIWAVVSQEFNRDRLQRDIAKRVGLEFEQNATTESQAETLHCFLKNKKLLLLLDDIWQVVDLEELGIPSLCSSDNNVHSSKVVFTTRFENVCDQMATFRHKKIKLERLTADEAWNLFINKIGETVKSIITSNEGIRGRAQTVVDKCAGLPLALVVIARAMSGNKTRYEWEDAINSINELFVEGTYSLYSILKFSYDRLKNDQMRKCFLCCALWPEDHNIEKDELIKCWLGMGHIADFNNINAAISKGHSIIEGLKGAAMLEETEEDFTIYVKLHDIIRGMALWIASECGKNVNKWIVRTGVKTNTIIAHEAEIVSLMYSEVNSLSQFRNCPNLAALMLQRSKCNEDETVDVDGFIKNILALTYLDMSYPNWPFRVVYSLVAKLNNLVRLQCLDLSVPYFLSLPKELVELTELKYLFIRYGGITSIPHGLISGLKKLEILDLSRTLYRRWEQEGEASVEELGRKNAAGGLKAVGITLTASILRRLSSNHPHVPLWHLRIYLDEEEEEDLSGKRLQTMFRLSKSLFAGGIFPRSLQSLVLADNFNIVEMSIAGGKEDRLDNLERLEFSDLIKLRKISWEGGVVPRVLFQNLSSLRFDGCHQLKDVSWIAQLPCLEILVIQYCEGLEQVIGGAEDDGEGAAQEQDRIEAEAEAAAAANRVKILPNLKFLDLFGVDSLRSFCSPQITLPSLQRVEIRNCPQLDLSFLKETKAKVVLFKGSVSDRYDVTVSPNSESTESLPFPRQLSLEASPETSTIKGEEFVEGEESEDAPELGE